MLSNTSRPPPPLHSASSVSPPSPCPKWMEGPNKQRFASLPQTAHLSKMNRFLTNLHAGGANSLSASIKLTPNCESRQLLVQHYLKFHDDGGFSSKFSSALTFGVRSSCFPLLSFSKALLLLLIRCDLLLSPLSPFLFKWENEFGRSLMSRCTKIKRRRLLLSSSSYSFCFWWRLSLIFRGKQLVSRHQTPFIFTAAFVSMEFDNGSLGNNSYILKHSEGIY